MQPKLQRRLFPNVNAQKLVTYSIFETPDHGTRCVLQVILELENTWDSTVGKFWEKAVPIVIDENSPSNILADIRGTGGSIPSTINSYAKLFLWCASAAKRVSPTEQVIEDREFGRIKVVQIDAGDADDGKKTVLIRISIPIEDNYASLEGTLWSKTKEINNVALPGDLLT